MGVLHALGLVVDGEPAIASQITVVACSSIGLWCSTGTRVLVLDLHRRLGERRFRIATRRRRRRDAVALLLRLVGRSALRVQIGLVRLGLVFNLTRVAA